MVVSKAIRLTAASRSWRATTRPNSASTGTSCGRASRPRLRARQIQQVADDALEALRLLAHDAEVAVARVGVERQLGHRQRLEVAAHRGQRRHQLVRHVGEQLPPRAVGGLSCSRACRRSAAIRLNAAASAATSSPPSSRARAVRSPAPTRRSRPRDAAAAAAPGRRSTAPPAPCRRSPAPRRPTAMVGPSCRSGVSGIADTRPTTRAATMTVAGGHERAPRPAALRAEPVGTLGTGSVRTAARLRSVWSGLKPRALGKLQPRRAPRPSNSAVGGPRHSRTMRPSRHEDDERIRLLLRDVAGRTGRGRAPDRRRARRPGRRRRCARTRAATGPASTRLRRVSQSSTAPCDASIAARNSDEAERDAPVEAAIPDGLRHRRTCSRRPTR